MKALDGVNDAVFDFATLTLHVKARDTARIVEEVRKIEPAVEPAPRSKKTTRLEPAEGPGAFRFKKELTILAAAAVLFCIQLSSGFIGLDR